MVETTIGLLRYDYLVLATGAEPNYFGDAAMEKNAIALKSVEDAIELRNTVLSNFEQALQLGDYEQLNSLLDFVIVGGGPTGVEIAGALSELRTHVFPKDYREIDFKRDGHSPGAERAGAAEGHVGQRLGQVAGVPAASWACRCGSTRG